MALYSQEVEGEESRVQGHPKRHIESKVKASLGSTRPCLQKLDQTHHHPDLADLMRFFGRVHSFFRAACNVWSTECSQQCVGNKC